MIIRKTVSGIGMGILALIIVLTAHPAAAQVIPPSSPAQQPQSGMTLPTYSYQPSAAASSSGCPSGKNLCTLASLVMKYFQIFLVLIMGFAVVMFTYNVIMYFVKPDADRKAAGAYVMYSIIGFFVVLSIWGLVAILSNTFELDNNKPASWSSFTDIFPK